MEELGGIVASAAGGGVFGLVGTIIGRAAGYFERKQDNAHERARWTHERELTTLQAEIHARENAAETALANTTGRWSGLAASLEAEAAIGETYHWVSAVRALTRPILTLLLWGITGLIFLGAEMDDRAAIVETATFAATAATLWWFGDRGPLRKVR